MSEGWVWAAISLTSGAVATALFVKWRLEESGARLSEHLAIDAAFHKSVIDRLARVETKLDLIIDGDLHK